MAEKPPLVVAVEQALRGPTRWVRYTPGAGPARASAPAPAQVVSPMPSVDEEAMPPLVAAVEAALGTTVDTLRYLPSLTAIPTAAPTSTVPVSHRAPFDDEALLSAAEAAVEEAVLWLRYQPTGGEVRAVSLATR